MDYFGLTSNQQIMGVLTVDSSDIDESTIESYGLEDDLGRFLDAVPEWETIAADVAVPSSKNKRRLRIAAKYFCAGMVGKRAQVFILKKSTDGSNEGQRSDKDGWAWLAEGLLNDAYAALNEVLDDLGLIPEPVMPYNVISVSIPDRDPVKTPRGTR